MNGELPKGWVWTSLENCIDILDSQRKPINAEEREERIQNKNESDLYPYYGATGQVGWIEGYIFDEELILLGEDGAPFLDFSKDKSYLIKGKTWVNNHAHVLRAVGNVANNRYICHYLNICDYRNYITGTTRYKLNQSQMRKIHIPLSPLAEQQRIVNKIEELFTNLDKGVESLKEVKSKLKVYRQAILKYAMEGKLTEKWREENKDKTEPVITLINKINIDAEVSKVLPESWSELRVKDIGEIVTGTTPSKSINEYYGHDCSFFKPKDLNKGYYVKTSEDGLSFKGMEKSRVLPIKSILVTCIGATIGKTGFTRVEGASNQQINAIIPFKNVIPEFVYFYSISPQFQKNIIVNSSSTTLPILNKSKFEILELFVPPLEEQKVIVERIEKLFSLADYIEETVDSKLEESKILRQSILKKAFEGKLVPQDPNDEPAEILLQKIKMEKSNKGKLVQEKLVE
ncbi:MAG: hypothetical protein HPY60_03485 [Candidatus Methanofastidiosum sp.]|nr:hypothetical protein [Methanofastidiosum sp.]